MRAVWSVALFMAVSMGAGAQAPNAAQGASGAAPAKSAAPARSVAQSVSAAPAKKPGTVAAPAAADRLSVLRPQAVPMPMDPKLVVYPYDANYSFPIRCSVNNYTHIMLDPDEVLVGVYYYKELYWDKKVSGTKRDIYFSPKQFLGADTPLSIITTKRRIEATLIALPETAPDWYQRVSWHTPGAEGWEDADALSSLAAAQSVKAAKPRTGDLADRGERVPPPYWDQDRVLGEGESSPVNRIDPSKMDFGYVVKGDADFRPELVFSDERTTYFRFPQGVLLPAIFALDEAGQAQVVNFVPGDGWYQVQRVLRYGAILKRNDAEIRIERKSGGSCGFFGCKKPSNFVGGQQ